MEIYTAQIPRPSNIGFLIIPFALIHKNFRSVYQSLACTCTGSHIQSSIFSLNVTLLSDFGVFFFVPSLVRQITGAPEFGFERKFYIHKIGAKIMGSNYLQKSDLQLVLLGGGRCMGESKSSGL